VPVACSDRPDCSSIAGGDVQRPGGCGARDQFGETSCWSWSAAGCAWSSRRSAASRWPWPAPATAASPCGRCGSPAVRGSTARSSAPPYRWSVTTPANRSGRRRRRPGVGLGRSGHDRGLTGEYADVVRLLAYTPPVRRDGRAPGPPRRLPQEAAPSRTAPPRSVAPSSPGRRTPPAAHRADPGRADRAAGAAVPRQGAGGPRHDLARVRGAALGGLPAANLRPPRPTPPICPTSDRTTSGRSPGTSSWRAAPKSRPCSACSVTPRPR
jgi:hypothetical protein